MKILITGYTGQLGFDVFHEAKNKGFEVVGVGSKDLDITNESKVKTFVKSLAPDVIIHCAAYTAVDKAEDDKEACWNVNVNGTKYLAQSAQEVNAKFLYISTDYVFDGEGINPFQETDTPAPVGFYGLSKYEGERIVESILDKWFILRISWVFGGNGNNFVDTMIRLAENRNTINVVSDQVGSPSYTFDLAKLIIEMIQSEKYGIYHATNEGYCSWADFAKQIFKLTKQNVTVNGITTEEYPTNAKRPKNSRLSKENLVNNGFNPLPYWQDALRHYLKEDIRGVEYDKK